MLVISPVSPFGMGNWPLRGRAPTPDLGVGANRRPCHTAAAKTPWRSPPAHLGSPHSPAILPIGVRSGGALGAMSEDALSKAERYRQKANRYGELAKQAEPGYLAEVFRKVAARYVFMAEDVLRERQPGVASGSQHLDVNARARAFLDPEPASTAPPDTSHRSAPRQPREPFASDGGMDAKSRILGLYALDAVE
jgi:hypothetical protein